MTRRARLEAELEPLLARWIAARGPARDRILLEAALGQSAGAAAELWRLDEHGWRPLLGLGEHDRLPPPERVRAVLEARLSEDVLPPGEQVVRAAGTPWALALGGAPPDTTQRDARDVLEALLLVRTALEARPAGDPEAPPFSLPLDASEEPEA